MKPSQDARPKWWQVYLTIPLLVVLFAIDTRLKLSTRGHQIMQIGTVLLVYGLVHLWIKANASALSGMDRRQQYGSVRVFRIPPVPLPDAGRERDPILRLPDSEIKGVLSDTFEMDIIDTEFLPSEEVPQELNKE